jgi:diguanylate cyclase
MGSDATRPSSIAREALRQLAGRRLPPTPENYTRAYQEIAHVAHPASASPAPDDAPPPAWGPLIRDLFRAWDTRARSLTQARKREALEHVLAAFRSPDTLYAHLRGLVRAWTQTSTSAPAERPLASTDDPLPPAQAAGDPAGFDGAHDAPSACATDIAIPSPGAPAGAEPATATPGAAWRELLADALVFGVAERFGYTEDLAREASDLAGDVRSADDDTLPELVPRLRKVRVAVELQSDECNDVQQALLRLLRLLALNLSELVGSDTWLRGQLAALVALTEGPLNHELVRTLERSLREITLKQGMLKHSLDQVKDAVKHMVSTFIDRLSMLAEGAGDYHDRLSGYAQRIASADDIGKLSDVVLEVMNDTRSLQTDLARTREELLENRRRVEEYQREMRKLESEMATLSDRVHEDALTELPNRRGLARAFDAECARAERHDRPLCLAVLDVDNFKQINDRLGHQAGDLALVHLARSVRRAIRPSDAIARFGGEEFVILLPETVLDEAVGVMQRVQRELTKRIFLHDHERVLITFSAGVAQWIPGESQNELVARADTALYRAKQAGKNRVAAAEGSIEQPVLDGIARELGIGA